LRAGKLAEAIAATEKVLAIERTVLGASHDETIASLNLLAELHEERGDFAGARKARQEALDGLRASLGVPRWRVTDVRLALEDLEHRSQMTPAQRQQLTQARALNRHILELYRQGKYREAIQPAQQALALRKEVLGEKHRSSATSLNNLAELYRAMGEYARAEPLYREALAIKKEALGPRHPAYAASLNNLAGLYKAMGDYARAEPLYRQALAISKVALGDKHPHYAAGLNNLARLYEAMGDYGRAEPLHREALAINKEALGPRHPAYAASLNNLAGLYKAMGEYARAEPLHREALALRKEALGERHPDYAASLNNLAALYEAMGDYARAEPLLREAQAIDKQALGPRHPNYATDLNNLAALSEAMGDYARAEPLFREALAITKEALGERHAGYGTILNNLALLCWAQADHARAERLLRQGLDICRDSLDLAAAAQSERQQLAMAAQLRGALDGYLALAPQAQRAGADAYAYVLGWKGSVLSRQRRLRLQRQHPELASDFSQLDRVAGRLAALALAVPEPKQQAAYHKQVQELSEQKEQLEGDLARKSAAFGNEQQAQRLTPASLQKALPADTALVDFLEYTHRSPPQKGKGPWQFERHLAAFVVRPDSIRQLDLGPVQPVAQAIDRWRQTTKRTRSVADQKDPAAELRRRLWQPLEPHLHGAKAVLVSPDGALARLPLAALPGSKPDSYLLEEVPLAVVPVPQLLPELLAARESDAGSEPSLLLVGDVDFGAAPGLADARSTSRSAPRGSRAGALPAFDSLQATREEILAVRDSFEQRFPGGTVKALRRDQATEAAVRQQAPKHRWLHLATHGFFAPPQLRSALAPVAERGGAGPALSEAGRDLFGRQGIGGFHPGLLSGLVLAGANRPAEPGADDGILTALEVAELDLSGVELATLSACETGLGEVAGGEGLLGLQRAFQTAGARSVLASLWQVDDEATRKLMVRFYDNLWRAKEPLGKLAALREAQLWMLREGVKRGLVRLPDKEATAGRTPPYYWAAFVLSGDWR
jgi:CHAT domain-containing protein